LQLNKFFWYINVNLISLNCETTNLVLELPSQLQLMHFVIQT